MLILMTFHRYFKYYRLAALYHIVKSLQSATPSQRLRNRSLALGAVAIYQINALIYRPAEGRAERLLLAAACQHLSDEEEDCGTRPIMYGRGLYFLSDIMEDGPYYLPDIRPVDSWVLEAFYRTEDMSGIETGITQTTIYPARKPRRTLKVTGIVENQDIEHDLSDEGSLAGESDQGGAEMWAEGAGEEMRPFFECETPIDGGPETAGSESQEASLGNDVEMASNGSVHMANNIGPTPGSSIDDALSPIQRQFPSDIFQLAPKSKAGGSFVKLNQTQRMSVTADIFRSLDFSQIFHQVQYQVMTPKEWYTLVFARYFPAKGTVQRKALQNFPSATYYQEWTALMDRLDEGQATTYREAAFDWFGGLCWIPHPAVDRMWGTRKDQSKNKTWVMVPEGEPQACPRLAINSKARSMICRY